MGAAGAQELEPAVDQASAATTGNASTRSLGLGSASAAGSSASTAVCLASTATVSRTAASVAPPADRGEHAGGGRSGGEQVLRVAGVEREIGDRARPATSAIASSRVDALARRVQRDGQARTSMSRPGSAWRRNVQSIESPSSALGAPMSVTNPL